ncbi:imidazolonepropionase [Halomonas denitrificans]|nr:imidazolonepropionase [Halomonas denitrificans]
MTADLRIDRARLDDRDEPVALLIDDGLIQAVIEPGDTAPPRARSTFDAAGRCVLPGFVDVHTHACFAGSRLDEWQRKLAGVPYLQLLEEGGGIMATVRATRAADEDRLAATLLVRLERMLRHGSTTIEVKSGYGLETATELKMLRAIRQAGETFPGTVVPTACIGHAIDPDVEVDEFVRRTIEQTLPAISEEFPGIALDAYCEHGAWSPEHCIALFEAGAEAGHPIRVHADQFNALGMIEAAIERGFASVDHLEATDANGLRTLARSDTFGVMLPASGFHLDDRYGDGRAFVDAGGNLALGSNFNPGSAPCYSMPFVIQLAVRKLGLEIDEAIAAATASGARLLGLHDRGRIEPGLRADLVVLDTDDRRALAFEFGGNPVIRTLAGGRWVEPPQ